MADDEADNCYLGGKSAFRLGSSIRDGPLVCQRESLSYSAAFAEAWRNGWLDALAEKVEKVPA